MVEPMNDDQSSWLVYADSLQQQGDPRGELIMLCAENMTDKAKKFVEDHVDALYGTAKFLLAEDQFAGRTWKGWRGAEQEYQHLKLEWTTSRFGFIDAITVHGLDDEGNIPGAIHHLLACSLGRFARALHFQIEDFGYEGQSGTPNWGEVVSAVVGAHPNHLRALSWNVGGYQLSWTESGDLRALWAEVPRLEELSIQLGRIQLGDTFELPQLRSLEIESGGFAGANVRAIGARSWPMLERMILFLGTDEYGGDTTRQDLAGIVDRPEAFPKLRHLALCNSEIEAEIAAAVAGSPLLPQLLHLDLSKGTMIDREGEVLIRNAAAFAHLESLDLSENFFSPDFTSELATALPNAIVDGQRFDEMDDEDYRFTVIGE
jgi:uncharacterized protein (TIGR02996 family)